MKGTLVKRGSKWSVVVDLGRDGTGRRIRKWHSGYATRREAEKARIEILNSVQTGSYVAPTRLTVGAYLTDWLEAVASKLAPSTLHSYDVIVRTRLIPRVGGIELQALTATDIEKMYGWLLTVGGKKDTGLSPKSVQNTHVCLGRALADAVRHGHVVRNVASLAQPPRVVRPDMQTWTADELRTFLASVAQDRYYAAWLLLASTGMRRGEALGLRWRDVDLDAARVSIVQTVVTVDSHRPQLSTPKTAKSRRSIALDRATIAALRTHRAQQAEERLALGAGWADLDLVFTRADGGIVAPDTFSWWFERHVEKAGLPRIRLHDLRHTYATLALQAGVHPKIVSERLGHSGVGITLDTYSHVTPALESDAAERVASLILGAAT